MAPGASVLRSRRTKGLTVYQNLILPGRPMIVWLWDTWGPDRRGRGVSGDRATAQRAAEACLRSGHASGARLEEALAILGTESLTSLYQRTGQGWQARHDTRGGISWEPLTAHPRDTDPLPGLGYAR